MAFQLDTRPVFTAVTLTGSYVTQTTPPWIEGNNVDQITVSVAYTMGAAETANSLQFKIEVANPVNGEPTSTDWEVLTTETVTAGSGDLDKKEQTYTADSAAATFDRFNYPFPASYKFIRFAVKETGIAANGGTLTLKATLRREQTF